MYKKKVYFFVVISVIFSSALFSSISARSQLMPSFKMQLSNGKVFSSKDLSQQKPVIIIYFSPDCEHCQILMDTLFKRITDFKKSHIVMVTFERANEVVDFEKHYQTSKYPNIKVGTEVPIFFFKTYYHLEHTPFTALFDKHGKLIVSYKDQTAVDDLIKRLKKLK